MLQVSRENISKESLPETIQKIFNNLPALNQQHLLRMSREELNNYEVKLLERYKIFAEKLNSKSIGKKTRMTKVYTIEELEERKRISKEKAKIRSQENAKKVKILEEGKIFSVIDFKSNKELKTHSTAKAAFLTAKTMTGDDFSCTDKSGKILKTRCRALDIVRDLKPVFILSNDKKTHIKLLGKTLSLDEIMAKAQDKTIKQEQKKISKINKRIKNLLNIKDMASEGSSLLIQAANIIAEEGNKKLTTKLIIKPVNKSIKKNKN